MIKRLIIKDIDDLNPAMADYGVILSETHPEVEFITKKQWAVDAYLWYNFQLEPQENTFTDYYREKLGITNVNIALREIDKWNDEVSKNKLTTRMFNKIIDLGDIKFGVLHRRDSNKSIVMMNSPFRYPRQKTVYAGYGGYLWQYLDPLSSPSDTELKRYFNLSSTQRRSFRNQW